MKKALKISGIILGSLFLIILLFVSWIEFSSLPQYEVYPVAISISKDSATIQHGRQIALVYCGMCHLGEDGKFSGRHMTSATNPMAELWTANITHHPTLGLGRYSDSELAYLLRTGVKRDGKMAGYFMSSLQMSDNDLTAVISYLRSNDKL
ncbi:MAG TPA: c-type cytochrome, partial [Saprospiraceae bacterium]|nr:c-type cytochrome [Saprospiraceae bacterium]